MLKVGSYVLVALLLFAAVFALLPAASSPRAETGATLRGVTMTFYPASDPEAYWTFQADTVGNDPLSGETHLSKLEDGGRWIRERDGAGNFTGKANLDATLDAQALTIDRNDNMTTQAATITLVQECAAIRLTGDDQEPVKVEQSIGFSAPKAEVDSPDLKGEVLDMQMTFDFNVLDSSPESTLGWNMNSEEQCIEGERVPI